MHGLGVLRVRQGVGRNRDGWFYTYSLALWLRRGNVLEKDGWAGVPLGRTVSVDAGVLGRGVVGEKAGTDGCQY